MPAIPRNTQEVTKAVYDEIMALHLWDSLFDIRSGITELPGPLGAADEVKVIETWRDHLNKVLRFPLNAIRTAGKQTQR